MFPNRVQEVLMQQPLAVLPAALRESIGRRLAERSRTVWDARRIARPLCGRRMLVALDDGQFATRPLEGVFHDIVHHPDIGFQLVFRRLRPAGRIGERGERRAIPLALIRTLPASLAFLRGPPAQWPMPVPFVACPAPGCGGWTAGRFCPDCGTLARRGPGSAFLGEGFSVVQSGLREQGASECSCGAVSMAGAAYCTKCGRACQP